MGEAWRLGLRDAIRVLRLGRIVVVFVAEGAHRHGNPPADVGRTGERPSVMFRPLWFGFGHLAPH
jgi:hypothetical protein